MKVFLTIYGWSGIMFFCSFFSDDHWTDPADNMWTQVFEQKEGDLDFAMNIKSFPNISEASWLELKVTNHATHPIQIINAFYKLELHAYDMFGELVTEGYFTSSDPSEIFRLQESINPFDLPELPIGEMVESERLSALCTTLLGVPTQTKFDVRGKFEFQLEIKDEKRKLVKIKDIPLSFSWWAPRKAEMAILLNDLRTTMKSPESGQLANNQLMARLQMPDLAKELTTDEVLSALDARQNVRDGRPALAYFAANHYSQRKTIIEYYKQGLLEKDHRILPDLLNNKSLLQPAHHDALLAWIPSAGASTKFRLLELLHQHRDAILTKNISVSLSAHIQELYGDLLLAQPKELSKRELVSWAAAVEMWSYTGDPAAIPFIQPFLKCHNKILGNELLLDMNSCNIPKPRRVDEFAMESILRIQGFDLFDLYSKKGFHPPYEDGSATSHISSIRKQVIQDYKVRIANP